MAASKRPSTSSLRRFITSRPYVTVAELRRRFGLDDPDAISCLAHEGRLVYLGLPEREALKIEDLLGRGEIGLEMSVEVRAPVAVGVYPIRIARYVVDGGLNGAMANGAPNGAATNGALNGYLRATEPGDPAPALMATQASAPDSGQPIGSLQLRDAAVERAPETAGDEAGETQLSDKPADGPAATPDGEPNGHHANGNGLHPRDGRPTRHNGRRVPTRQRRHRFHRARPGPGPMPGDAPSQ
jgi:hypothetical protein